MRPPLCVREVISVCAASSSFTPRFVLPSLPRLPRNATLVARTPYTPTFLFLSSSIQLFCPLSVRCPGFHCLSKRSQASRGGNRCRLLPPSLPRFLSRPDGGLGQRGSRAGMDDRRCDGERSMGKGKELQRIISQTLSLSVFLLLIPPSLPPSLPPPFPFRRPS